MLEVLPKPKKVVLITPTIVANAPDEYFAERGAILTCDAVFEKFLKAHNPYEHLDKNFYCSFYQTKGGTNASIMSEFGVTTTLTPNMLHVVLRFFSSDGGFAFLKIPDGDDEIHLIIGYAESVIYYVEHAYKKGIRTVHLGARSALREWRNEKPLVMVF